jgi:hypothetical protein
MTILTDLFKITYTMFTSVFTSFIVKQQFSIIFIETINIYLRIFLTNF